MSYSLFDKGYTAAEIQQMGKPTPAELEMQRFNKWKESEHVLEILRQIKGSKMDLDRKEAELWQKATKRRR